MPSLMGLGRQAGYLSPEGKMPRINRALLADAIATMAGALLGTSTVVTYIESSTGVSEGGRTGLTATVVAALFLLAAFFAPLVGTLARMLVMAGFHCLIECHNVLPHERRGIDRPLLKFAFSPVNR